MELLLCPQYNFCERRLIYLEGVPHFSNAEKEPDVKILTDETLDAADLTKLQGWETVDRSVLGQCLGQWKDIRNWRDDVMKDLAHAQMMLKESLALRDLVKDDVNISLDGNTRNISDWRKHIFDCQKTLSEIMKLRSIIIHEIQYGKRITVELPKKGGGVEKRTYLPFDRINKAMEDAGYQYPKGRNTRIQ